MSYCANVYCSLPINLEVIRSLHETYFEMTSGEVGVNVEGSISTFSTGVSSSLVSGFCSFSWSTITVVLCIEIWPFCPFYIPQYCFCCLFLNNTYESPTDFILVAIIIFVHPLATEFPSRIYFQRKRRRSLD